MTEPAKILIIKHGALGDIIQGIDAFAAVRRGHPDALVSLLTTKPFAAFTAAMPFFDQVLIDDRAKPWNISALLRIRRIMGEDWTRIYDFQSSRRTARYFKSLVRPGVEFVGVHQGVSHPIGDMSGINNRDRMVMTAEKGGCHAVDAPVDAPVDWLLHTRPEGAPVGDYAVLFPGCSPAKPAKKWAGTGYAQLADAFVDKGIIPVLAGTNIDRAAGDEVLAHAARHEQIVDLIGRTSLMALAGLVRDARLVIGNDTGPVFLGARLGAPTLMVMSGHTDPSMSAPYGPKVDWIRRPDLNDLTAADVAAAAFALIS